MGKAERTIFNANFSNLPTGVAVLLPAELKKREAGINYLIKNKFNEPNSFNSAGKKSQFDVIKRNTTEGEVGIIVDASKKNLNGFDQKRSTRKRGSMHIGELFTRKQIQAFTRHAQIDKIHEASKELARESLPEKLKKLETLYEKKVGLDLVGHDVNQILYDFHNSGINSPMLKVPRRGTSVPLKTVGGDLKTEESIIIETGTCKTEIFSENSSKTGSKNEVSSINTTESGGQSTAQYIKSLSDTKPSRHRKMIAKEGSFKAKLPKLGRELSQTIGSLEELEAKQKCSYEDSPATISTYVSVGTIEHNFGSYASVTTKNHTRENSKTREKEIYATLGLIKNIAGGGGSTKNGSTSILEERKNGRKLAPSSFNKMSDFGATTMYIEKRSKMDKDIENFKTMSKHYREPVSLDNSRKRRNIWIPNHHGKGLLL